MSLPAGTHLGPYEIVASLGAGGMGEVYRARDTRLGREVAVKVLPASFAADPDRLRRFEQEARAAGKLNHPNILAVYDVGTHEGSPYLVTELLEGETLRELGAIPQRKALEYARQIARGLAAAHEKGITHRDLKPENIFVTRDERVKILDFGLAKLTQKEESFSQAPTTPGGTQPGAVLGTVGYMSPEQVRGQPADHRADIFSLGAILYEMLSNRRPFHRETAAETMTAILKEDPPALPQAGLERVVQRCLEKRPEQRFQSASDLAFALEAPSGLSTPAGEAVPPVPTRRPSLGVALALSLAVAAGLAAGIWWETRKEIPAPGWTGIQLGGSSVALHPRISPDGRTLAFLGIVAGQSQVAVMNPGSGNWSVLTHNRSLGSVDNISWSRDGAKIYFDRVASVPRGIFSVPAVGGDERLILEDAGQPEVLPDGSLLVQRINAERNLQLYRFWPETGRLEALGAVLFRLWSATFRASPDGGEAVFFGRPLASSGPAPPHLYAFDLASGKTRRLAPELNLNLENFPQQPLAVTSDGRSVLTTVKSGDLYRVVTVPRIGGEPTRTLVTFAGWIHHVDVGSDGSLYLDQVQRPLDVLRFPVSGGVPEQLASLTTAGLPCPGVTGCSVVPFPDGRMLLPAQLSGRNRLLVAGKGKDPVAFVETEEETSAPMTLIDDREVAFMVGAGAKRTVAIASVADGRMARRLPRTQGLPILHLASSPDGKTLYYAASGDIWAIPAAGGEPRRLAAGDAVAADPAGQDLIVARREKGGAQLLWLSLSKGTERPIPFSSSLSLVVGSIGPLSVHKDGRILVRVSSSDSWFDEIAVLDPKTGKVEKVPVSSYIGDLFSPGWTSDGQIVTPALELRGFLWRFQKESKP